MSKLKKALEKAKEGRVTVSEFFIKKENDSEPDTKSISRVDQTQKGQQDLKIEYSRTKVKDIDPDILKSSRIFSVSHEDSTTDRINILRTQILKKLEEIGGNTLLVTSANPGEGKTFTSINLAISISRELNRTVLLVDVDLKQPLKTHVDFTSDFFKLEKSKGLADILLGEAELPDVLINPGIPRLTILPGGRSLPNSSELLASERMQSLIQEMKSRYSNDRIIIFDSSSILLYSDTLALSRFVDAVLLVVEVEKTSPADLKRVKEVLKDSIIIGTVVNKAQGDV